jgi:hypothetical protein
VFRLRRTPITLEIRTQVKDEIFHQKYLAAFYADYTYATILTYSSISVRELDIPVHSNDVGPGQSKDVPDTDVLHIESDLGELVKKSAEPAFDSTLSLESAACGYFTGVNKDPIIPPRRHELGQIMSVQSLERASYGFSGNKCSNHEILLSETIFMDVWKRDPHGRSKPAIRVVCVSNVAITSLVIPSPTLNHNTYRWTIFQ